MDTDTRSASSVPGVTAVLASGQRSENVADIRARFERASAKVEKASRQAWTDRTFNKVLWDAVVAEGILDLIDAGDQAGTVGNFGAALEGIAAGSGHCYKILKPGGRLVVQTIAVGEASVHTYERYRDVSAGQFDNEHLVLAPVRVPESLRIVAVMPGGCRYVDSQPSAGTSRERK